MTKEVNDQNFNQEILEVSNEKPVLVDFWAPWCGPCQMMGPVLEELSEEVGDEAVVAKLNVDENPENSQKYAIQSIPALKIFKGGEVVGEMVGVQTKEALINAINDNK